jgi:hypothetical protein
MPEDKVQGQAQTPSNGQLDHIAERVIFWSGLGITLTSIALIVGAVIAQFAASGSTSGDLKEVTTTIFHTLIPLFGTWVGTVLAYYFSGKNFADAHDRTLDLMSQIAGDRLKAIPVKDVWIPVAAIEAVTILAGQSEADISFEDIRTKLSTKVTRIPVWNENKAVLYVIHESMVYKYLAGTRPEHPTLADFLNDQHEAMRAIVTKIGWIAFNSTLADAKAKMESISGCQDVFITQTGINTDPILGWITNIEIANRSRA